MIRTNMRTKLAASALAASMLFSLPVASAFADSGKPAGAAYSTVQLHAVQTKQISYYKPDDPAIDPSLEWVTDASQLTFLPDNLRSGVTVALKDADGVYWLGTTNGLQRVNFAEADARDIVQYMAGPRYLYGGDDAVLALASDNAGGIWARTASGVTHIAMPETTLYEKTQTYEKMIQSVNDRRGMVTGASFTFSDPSKSYVDYNSDTGAFVGYPTTNDNDGLWTTMYAMGEIFRYRALSDDYGPSPTAEQQAEIADAKAAALRATKAVLLLDYISGRGNGFPARSYMLTSEAGAQTSDGTDAGYQSQNGFWFHSVVDPSQPNPNGIIPSLQRDDLEPIGYSIVRVTDDAMTKKGSTLFPSGGTDVMNYNGLGLSQPAIDALNETRPDGQKLGIDIKTNVGSVSSAVYQVLPVITNATNNTVTSKDHTTSASNPPLFQLTAPIYERIPQFFNDLFPASAIGADGYVDQNQIVYKADTSSDEVDGHYALFFTAYKYLIGSNPEGDPELEQLKDLIEQTTDRMTNLILEDDHYYIEDATGKSTQWSRWLAQYFNDSRAAMEAQPLWEAKVGVDENGDDALSYGFEDGPLNALEVMAALKTATYITADAYPGDSERFQAAYDLSFDGTYSKEEPFVNGKGYIGMALEYQERRLVRQATNAYNVNDNQTVTHDNPGYSGDIEDNSNINAALHNDWTQYINYSDEELGWFPVFILIELETDPARHAQIVAAYDQWYENEKREENPFYTFLYQLAHPDDATVDLASAVRFLYRMPDYRIEFPVQFERQDVFYIEPGDRDDYKQSNYALPTDERAIVKNNSNPFEGNNASYSANPAYNYNAGTMESATVFTLPYWMGRYFGIIEE